MATITINSKVEESVWNELKATTKESHQNVSGFLTEAIVDYLRRQRIRPVEEAQHKEAEQLVKVY